MSLLVPGVGRPKWQTRGGGADGGGGGAHVIFMIFVHVYVFTFDMVVYWAGAPNLEYVCMMI